jgi:hypothetical protein
MKGILKYLFRSPHLLLLVAGAVLMPLNAAESLFDTAQQQQPQSNATASNLIVTDTISPGVDSAQAAQPAESTNSVTADGNVGTLDHVDPSFFRAPGTPVPQAVSETNSPSTDSVVSQPSPTPNSNEGTGLHTQNISAGQDSGKPSTPSSEVANAEIGDAGTKDALPRDQVATGTNVLASSAPSPSPDTAAQSAPSNTETKSAETSLPAIPKKPAVSIPVDAPPNMDEPPERMAATAVPPPSENVTLNLINRLVQRGS